MLFITNTNNKINNLIHVINGFFDSGLFLLATFSNQSFTFFEREHRNHPEDCSSFMTTRLKNFALHRYVVGNINNNFLAALLNTVFF